MTTEEKIAQMEKDIAELMAYKAAREIQQLTAPVDETSKRVLGVVTSEGNGSTATTHTIVVSSTPQTITVPVNPAGTVILDTEGGRVEVAVIAYL